MFEKVRKLSSKRRHGCKKKDELCEYIFSGKLFCSKCGSSIVGHSGKRKNEDELYHYYVCNGRITHKCDLPNSRKEELEDEVARTVFDYISSTDIDVLIKRMMAYNNNEGDKSELSILKSKINEIDKQLLNYLKAIKNGFYSSKMNDDVSNLEDKKKRIEERLNSLKTKEKPIITENAVRLFISTVKDSEYEFAKESILRDFVKSVYIDEEYMKILIYPCYDPIIKSRKDSFEIENDNNDSGGGEKGPSNGDDSSEHQCAFGPLKGTSDERAKLYKCDGCLVLELLLY